jgi:hypothetical protein
MKALPVGSVMAASMTLMKQPSVVVSKMTPLTVLSASDAAAS